MERDAAIAERDQVRSRLDHLQHFLRQLQRAQFGRRPEKLDPEQLALFKGDLIGINFGNNTDEYEPEAGTIIPRLSSAKSEEDVQSIVYEEFCRWFAGVNIGSREKYASVSAEIWKLWSAHGPDERSGLLE